MAASPDFYQPSAAPPYSPRMLLATRPTDDFCQTPTGAVISYLGEPGTCPPAPRKPPAPACRKHLFTGADVATPRFDDLESVFRPSSFSDGKQRGRRRAPKEKLISKRLKKHGDKELVSAEAARLMQTTSELLKK